MSEERRAYMPQSKATDWETPPELFDALDREFGPFMLDPACKHYQYSAWTIYNRGGWRFVDPAPPVFALIPNARIDGLAQPWRI